MINLVSRWTLANVPLCPRFTWNTRIILVRRGKRTDRYLKKLWSYGKLFIIVSRKPTPTKFQALIREMFYNLISIVKLNIYVDHLMTIVSIAQETLTKLFRLCIKEICWQSGIQYVERWSWWCLLYAITAYLLWFWVLFLSWAIPLQGFCYAHTSTRCISRSCVSWNVGYRLRSVTCNIYRSFSLFWYRRISWFYNQNTSVSTKWVCC